jgi:hypothetical protein
VLLLVLVLLIAAPASSFAKKWEDVCVGVTLTMSGQMITVLPEQCVHCWYWVCGKPVTLGRSAAHGTSPTSVHLVLPSGAGHPGLP